MTEQRRWRQTLGVGFVAAWLAVGAASAEAATRVYVRVGPPAPVVEVRGVAPARGRVWVGGYQRWNGRAYVWTPGRWTSPPRGRATWVAPRWVRDRRHGWYFVAGHWR